MMAGPVNAAGCSLHSTQRAKQTACPAPRCPGSRAQSDRMMKVVHMLGLALGGVLTACAPAPSDIRASPDDTWTWEVSQNYQRFAHCLTDALNNAPEHSWFYQAPRPVTSFEQQWQRNRVVLKSVDPANVEQVRIDVT